MQTLKKFFPLSFKFVKDGGNLAVGIIIYVLVGTVAPTLAAIISGVLAFVISLITFGLGSILAVPLGLLIGAVGGLISMYCLAGIVFQILVFTKVFTDPDAPIEVQATEENGTDAE